MTSSSTAFRKYIVRTAILGRSKGKGDTEKKLANSRRRRREKDEEEEEKQEDEE